MSDLIQLRRDTAANWTTANPVLASGEPGVETDTGKVKIGDGTSAWNTLAYLDVVSGGDTAWTTPTLTNSWVAYGAPFATPAFRKLSSGLVILRGAIKGGTIGTSTSNAAFQLPAGYRPDPGTTWAGRVGGDSEKSLIRVNDNGYVIPAVGLNTYVGLDGVNFYPAAA